jgi:hypothetical protein
MEDLRPLLLRLALLLGVPTPPPTLFFSATHLLVSPWLEKEEMGSWVPWLKAVGEQAGKMQTDVGPPPPFLPRS